MMSLLLCGAQLEAKGSSNQWVQSKLNLEPLIGGFAVFRTRQLLIADCGLLH